MKGHNIEGTSKGYVERVVASYSAVTVENVRNYSLSTLKFCELYLGGETWYTVNQKMREIRKKKKCHRGAVQLEIDHSKKVYDRNRF